MSALVVALCLAAGALLPVQAAVNGRAAAFLHSPFRGGLVSFAVGLLVLIVLSFASTRAWPESSTIVKKPPLNLD